MSENKFIQHLKGKSTAGSLVEVKNQSTPASFGNMPQGTSESQVKYADVRGDVTVVANGTMNWKIINSNLVPASVVSGDGQDFTSTYSVSGAGLWINATYTFPSTGDVNHPIAMIFNPNSKWVLKFCGDNLVVDNGSTVDLTLVITFGTTTIISKQFTVAEQANQFCKELVIDFAESNANMIKAQGLSTMKVQVLCGTANASARIYNGMTIFTVLQRKVDAAVVSGTFANVEEALRDGILPSDYFNNLAFISQIEDGDSAYAVFTRDGDTVALSGWAQPIPDQTNNTGKFLTTDGSLMSWAQLTISDVDGLSTELSDLQDQIDTLSGRGRFLSVWNCATGLPETDPETSPYEYKTGDYYIVGTVSSANPAVNYRPDGTEYISGIASTEVETEPVDLDDTYVFDGTNWLLQYNSQKEVAFSAVAGSPYDNTNLANALNAKINKSGDIMTGELIMNYAHQVSFRNNNASSRFYFKADGQNTFVLGTSLNANIKLKWENTTGNLYSALSSATLGTSANKWDTLYVTKINNGADIAVPVTGGTMALTSDIVTYTGSDGITLTGTNFTNSGVRSVSTGSTNGTISVNTNGTSADVAVYGLGSAAYTTSTDYATAAQGAKADTALQPADVQEYTANEVETLWNSI